MVNRHIDPATVDSHVVLVVYILDRYIQTIKAGHQRQRLPINLLAVQRLLQQLRRLIHLDRIFEGLHCLAGNGGHLAKNVHHARCHTVLGHKGDIPVLDLQRDRDQVHTFSHLHEVGTHVEWEYRTCQQLVFGDKSIQILELDRRRSEKLSCQLNTVEFLALLGISPRLVAAKALQIAAREPVFLVSVVHLLILRQAGAGNV